MILVWEMVSDNLHASTIRMVLFILLCGGHFLIEFFHTKMLIKDLPSINSKTFRLNVEIVCQKTSNCILKEMI